MSEKILMTSAIFVELDALLDTRLALLAYHDEKTLNKVLQANIYHTRLADSYPGLSIAEFYRLYDERHKGLLKYAIITPMIDVVKSFIYRTLKQTIQSPFHYKPKVIINTYPYQLTEEEVTIIIQSLIGLTDGAADIEAVYASYSEISPRYVKEHVSVMVLYEYTKWLDIHSGNGGFIKVTCPEVGLIGPQLYFKDYDSRENAQKVFTSMEQMTQPFIALQLMPVSYFSMIFTKS